MLSPHPFLSAITLRFSRLPYLRLHRAWAHEYTARATLERGWSSGSRSVQTEVGATDGLWLEHNGDRGIAWGDGRAVTFDLTTGKVERNALKIEQSCNSVKADPSRAVFGLSSGGVLCAPNHGLPIALKIPVFDNTSSGSSEPISWREPHAVTTALAWDRGLANLLASAGGEVVLWDVAGLSREERGRVLLVLGLSSAALAFPTPVNDGNTGTLPEPHVRKLIVDAKGHVFAFASNSKLLVWDIDFMDLLFKPAPPRPPAPIGPSRTVEVQGDNFVALEHDPRSERLLAVTSSSAFVYNSDGSLVVSFRVPPGEGELTAAAWDRDHAGEEPSEDLPAPDPEKPAPPKRAQYAAVALGTSVGTVLLYDLPAKNASGDKLQPRLVLNIPKASDKPRVTHLLTTPVLLVSAHTDGTLHIRSVLSGVLLRTVSVTGPPRIQRAIDSGRDGITCLKAAEGRGRIAAGVVGGGVRIWTFGAVVDGGWAKKRG